MEEGIWKAYLQPNNTDMLSTYVGMYICLRRKKYLIILIH